MSKDLKVQIIKEEENENIEPNLQFKVILLGDSGVGKSCLLIRGTRGIFSNIIGPTIGYEIMPLLMKIEDTIIKLQIWDTCGQETFRSIIRNYYRNSTLALIVYSIENENSFKNIEKWINDVKTNSSPDVIFFLIGNKTDLEKNRKVTKEMVDKFCRNNNIDFSLETSAKTGFNTENIFIEAAKMLYKQNLRYKGKSNNPHSLNVKFNEMVLN